MNIHSHRVGQRFGRITIKDVGPFQCENPSRPQKARARKVRWYAVVCDCGAGPYWVNHDQMRSHRQCAACAAMAKRKSPQVDRRSLPVPDFARLRLIEG